MRAADTSAAIGQGAASNEPAGYTLVLPPGWRQVPVRAGTREAIREIARDRFRVRPGHVSRDALTPYRIALEQQLTAAAARPGSRGEPNCTCPSSRSAER